MLPGAGAGRVAEEAEEALRLRRRRSGGREVRLAVPLLMLELLRRDVLPHPGLPLPVRLLARGHGREAARGRPRDWVGCACAWGRVVEAIVGV